MNARVLSSKRRWAIALPLAILAVLVAWLTPGIVARYRIAYLMSRLDSADVAVRKAAVKKLAAWKSDQVIDALVVTFCNEECKGHAREGVRDALIAIGPAVVEPILTCGESSGPTFPKWLPQRLRRMLGEKPPWYERPDALAASTFSRGDVLQGIGPAAAGPLIRLLGHARPDVRARAAFELWFLKPSNAVAGLVSLLKDRDGQVRWAAVRTLSRYRDARVVAPLISALEDPDDRVAYSAAEGLGPLHDPRAVGPLIDAIDKRTCVCGNAILSLGQLACDAGSGEAAQALLTYLNSPDTEKRAAAVHAVAWIRDQRALEPLIALLSDARTEVAAGAAMSLGVLGDDRAVAALTAVLNTANVAKEVKVKALLALSMIGGAEADAAALKFVTDGGEWAVTWEWGENVPDYIMYGAGRDILIAALRKAGDIEMANRLYWSDDAGLADAAAQWGREHDCLKEVTLLRERHEYAKWDKYRRPRK